jgi:hydrogenase maturation protein HypF
VSALAGGGVASPLTSSMGRLFDAVAALCGLRGEVTYEGQAAVELESAADRRESVAYPLPVVESGEGLVLDPRETVAAVAADSSAGVSASLVAARFHNAVAAATAEACSRLARELGLDTVVLSGGVFQNRLLLERTLPALTDAGLRPLVPERLPPGDGGIAYGQAAAAAARLAAGRGRVSD